MPCIHYIPVERKSQNCDILREQVCIICILIIITLIWIELFRRFPFTLENVVETSFLHSDEKEIRDCP